MPSVIVLNQNNLLANGQNNTLIYNFPNSVSFPHHEIAVQSVSMYYSWVNISAVLGNNIFYIYWPYNTVGNAGGSPGNTAFNKFLSLKVVIPDGQYEVATLNEYLQFICIQNGLYMQTTVNGVAENVYFIEFQLNVSKYAVQINTFAIPDITYFTYNATTQTWAANGTAPTQYSTWTTPTNWIGFTPSQISLGTVLPAIFMPAAFSTLFGYKANTATIQITSPGNTIDYPSGVVEPSVNTINSVAYLINQNFLNTYSYLSSVAPQLQPNSSVFLSVSNIQNKYASPNSIIYAMNPAVAFGEQINIVPPQFAWNKLLNGTYTQIRLQILGLNYQPLPILDPNMTIVLVIRDSHEGLDDLQSKITGGK